jgi:hypothetical protein
MFFPGSLILSPALSTGITVNHCLTSVYIIVIRQPNTLYEHRISRLQTPAARSYERLGVQ